MLLTNKKAIQQANQFFPVAEFRGHLLPFLNMFISVFPVSLSPSEVLLLSEKRSCVFYCSSCWAVPSIVLILLPSHWDQTQSPPLLHQPPVTTARSLVTGLLTCVYSILHTQADFVLLIASKMITLDGNCVIHILLESSAPFDLYMKRKVNAHYCLTYVTFCSICVTHNKSIICEVSTFSSSVKIVFNYTLINYF